MNQESPPSAARLDAADAVRRLVHSLVGRHGSEADLAEVATLANGLADRLDATSTRQRPAGQMLRYESPVADGDELSCWPDCMIAGVAHPYGTGLDASRQGDEAVAQVTLGPAHEGPPGRAHGGIVASLFDEVMGFALWMEAIPAFTAWLRVDYRAPVPLGRSVELRGRVARREGRKAFLAATASCDGELIAEAEGLFVVPREYHSGE